MPVSSRTRLISALNTILGPELWAELAERQIKVDDVEAIRKSFPEKDFLPACKLLAKGLFRDNKPTPRKIQCFHLGLKATNDNRRLDYVTADWLFKQAEIPMSQVKLECFILGFEHGISQAAHTTKIFYKKA